MSGQWPSGAGGWHPHGNVELEDDRELFQAILEACAANVLHAHNCHACGGRNLACRQFPCAWRPFDRNAAGEWWRCAFCRQVKEVLEHEGPG